MAAGAVRLLPSLQQCCPGLLDLQGTLVTAAQRCDLAGLQATWELLKQRLVRSLEPTHLGAEDRSSRQYREEWSDNLCNFGLWLLGAAVRSSTPDTLAKMERVLETSRLERLPAEVPGGRWTDQRVRGGRVQGRHGLGAVAARARVPLV